MIAPQKQFVENQMARLIMLYTHLFHFFIVFTSKAPGISIVFNTKQHWELKRGCRHLPTASAAGTWVLNDPRGLHWHQGLPRRTGQAAVHAQIARRAKHIATLLGKKNTQEVY